MKKLNNKGFSLVELIIVIAIMAILVGVVGTQVIPYLENSRKAKDIQILSAWNTAAVSAYSTEAGSLDSLKVYTINIVPATDSTVTISVAETAAGSTPSLVAAASATGAPKKLIDTFMGLTNLTGSNFGFKKDMASKAGKNITDVTITINGDDGQVVTATTSSGYTFDTIENK